MKNKIYNFFIILFSFIFINNFYLMLKNKNLFKIINFKL